MLFLLRSLGTNKLLGFGLLRCETSRQFSTATRWQIERFLNTEVCFGPRCRNGPAGRKSVVRRAADSLCNVLRPG